VILAWSWAARIKISRPSPAKDNSTRSIWLNRTQSFSPPKTKKLLKIGLMTQRTKNRAMRKTIKKWSF
jgi:hypothetical protein